MRLLLLLIFLSVSGAGVRAESQLEAVLVINHEELHKLIRQTAAKVEERFRGVHEEAGGLVKRVDRILKSKETLETEPKEHSLKLANEMVFMELNSVTKAIVGGIRGYVFDSSATGFQQRYLLLETVKASGAEEIRRLLEMKNAASISGWEEKSKACHQQALSAVRTWISREPENPEAHTLLAATLDWESDSGPATLAALNKARELDEEHGPAIQLLLERRIDKTLEAAAFRRATPLDKTEEGNVMRSLYDRPLTHDEQAKFELEQQKLQKEVNHLRIIAFLNGDLATYLNVMGDAMTLRRNSERAKHSQARAPEESFQDFIKYDKVVWLSTFGTELQDKLGMQKALQLCGNNAEAIGSLLILSLVGEAVNIIQEDDQSKSRMLGEVGRMHDRLLPIARGKDNINAGHACEALAVVELTLSMAGLKPENLDLMHRAVRLNPLSYRSINLLGIQSFMLKQFAAGRALFEIQLAVTPGFEARRKCAAAAVSQKDWTAAHRHLDACAKERPDHLAILNQRIVTHLRKDASAAAVRKAGKLYGDITEENVIPKTLGMEEGERTIFVHNYVLFLVLRGELEAAKALTVRALQAQIFSEKKSQQLNGIISQGLG